MAHRRGLTSVEGVRLVHQALAKKFGSVWGDLGESISKGLSESPHPWSGLMCVRRHHASIHDVVVYEWSPHCVGRPHLHTPTVRGAVEPPGYVAPSPTELGMAVEQRGPNDAAAACRVSTGGGTCSLGASLGVEVQVEKNVNLILLNAPDTEKLEHDIYKGFVCTLWMWQ